MMEKTGNKFFLKLGVLITGADIMFSMALLMPILGTIAIAFPGEEGKVQMLMTFPMLFVGIGMLASGKLADFFSKKTMLMIATAVFSLAGFATALVDDLNYMLAMRSVMGLAAGTMGNLVLATIAQIFEGKERATMMGWAAAVGSLFSLVMAVVAGFLAVMDWHYPFYLFLVYLLIIPIQGKFLPPMPPQKKDETLQLKKNEKGRLNGKVAIVAAHFFAFMMLNAMFTMSFAIFIAQEGFGDSINSGLATSLVTVCALVTAIFFGNIEPLLKKYLPVVGFIFVCATFLIIANAHSVEMVYLSAIPLGIFVGLFGPYCSTWVSRVVPVSGKTLAVSIVGVCAFIGQFSGAFVRMGIGAVIGEGFRTMYTVAAVIAAVCFVLALIYALVRKNDEQAAPKPEEEVVTE